MKYAEAIKKLRKKMILTQTEFANMLEVSFGVLACDGDSMKVITHYADGTSQSYSYSYCCYEDMRVKYNKLLLKIIPSDYLFRNF